ncbi:MAG: hypothetical protein KAZ26_23550 [Caldilineaceae bacterium]|nr:hypothetical protein [Caldilineaceae bacterium]
MSNNIQKVTTGNTVQMWQDPDQKAQIMELAADVFQIATEDRLRPDVQAAIMSAMNRCVQYGLLPASDVWMIPFTKNTKNPKTGAWEKITTYAVDTGVASWEKFANKRSQGDWMPEYREMSEQTVKDMLGNDYVSGCLGWECRIWRVSQVAAMEKIATITGKVFEPEWYAGFYLVEMKDEYKDDRKTGKKIAKPENIPSYRTAEDVAKRRALKHALSRNFTPCYVGDLGQEPEKQIVYALKDAKAELVERERLPDHREASIPAGGDRFTEDEDGMMWASDPVRKPKFVDSDGVISEDEDVVDGKVTVEEEVNLMALAATPQPTVDEGNEKRRAFAEFAKWSGGMKAEEKDAFRHFLATESRVGIPDSFGDATPDQLGNFADWLQDNNRTMAKYRSQFKVAQAA